MQPIATKTADSATRADGAVLVRHVLQSGPAQAGRLAAALSRPHHSGIVRTLQREGLMTEDTIARIRAGTADMPYVDPRVMRSDPRLAPRFGLGACLREGLLPWHSDASGVIVLVADPAVFHRNRAALVAEFGPVRPAIAPFGALAEALLQDHGPAIAADAESCVSPAESCRTLETKAIGVWLAVITGGLGLALMFSPAGFASVALLLAVAVFMANTLLRLAALLSARTAPAQTVIATDPTPDLLPSMSILVALYREADIAPRLVRRLERLDYPRDRLEVLLVVEDNDATTRDALVRADLPDWVRVVVAPAGSVRTKPRALNIALAQSRGVIIGVYDAEDAPDPAQLRRVAAQFATAPPDVACLQGALDFYNPCTNVMSRLFTLEYRTWFRIILPGLARLGLVVPLGGTTLFFRRSVLDALGAWDSHNVTEDADLGLRLYRRGWRTELLDSTTWEEANCHPLAWIKQRSRWSKGYMMTWAVHMRDPRRLWRDLGMVRFLALQVQLAGSVLGGLLAPVMWFWWLLLPASLHPYGPLLAIVLLLSGLLEAGTAALAHRRAGGGFHSAWTFALPLYHLLASAATVKALWELGRRPFFWDKTAHGRFGG